MIISIDGPVGSGKTTLTSLLSAALGGADFKFAPLNPATQHGSITHPAFVIDILAKSENRKQFESVTDFIDVYASLREEVRQLFQDETAYDKHAASRTFFLLNLIRVVLIRANKEASKAPYIFIDSFWNPLWTFEAQYYDRYFPIMCEMVSAPDISFFLKVDSEVASERAELRDPGVEHPANHAELKEKRNIFFKWARAHIPNFHTLQADLPINDVFDQAMDMIKKDTPSETPRDEVPAPVAPTEQPVTKSIQSFHKRITEKRNL